MDQEFIQKYIQPNIQTSDQPYSDSLFTGLLQQLKDVDAALFGRLGPGLLTAACCALRRGDAVPMLLASLLDMESEDQQIQDIYAIFSESITIVWPFIGIPQVVTAVQGMSAVLKSKGIKQAARKREDLSAEDGAIGAQVRKDVYKASSNDSAFQMMASYFGDFHHAIEAVAFGYGMGRALPGMLPRREMELCVLAAVAATGPTRQSKNHVMACFGYEFTTGQIQATLDVVQEISVWAKKPFAVEDFQIDKLAETASTNLKAS